MKDPMKEARKGKYFKRYYRIARIKNKIAIWLYKLKLKLFWLLWGTIFNDLKYSRFFDEVWKRENFN